MKKQIKSKLLAVVLTTLVTGLALPALAVAEVNINVSAIEYSNTFTVVSILAVSHNPVEDPTAWELTSLVRTHPNGDNQDLDITTAEVYSFPQLGSKLWVVKAGEDNLIDHTSLTTGSDTVTAVVSEGSIDLGSDIATCGPGVRRTRITAICK